jgi:hypothetical protein
MLLLGAVIVRQFISWRRESPPVARPTLVPPTLMPPTRDDPCDGLRQEIVALRGFIAGLHDGTRAHIEKEVQDARNLILGQRRKEA